MVQIYLFSIKVSVFFAPLKWFLLLRDKNNDKKMIKKMKVSIKMTLRYRHFFPLLKYGVFKFFIKGLYYALLFKQKTSALVMCPLFNKIIVRKIQRTMSLEYFQLLELSVETTRNIRTTQLHFYF